MSFSKTQKLQVENIGQMRDTENMEGKLESEILWGNKSLE